MIKRIPIIEKVGIKGRVIVTLRDAKTNKIISQDIHDNLIVSTGKEAISARMVGDTSKVNRGEFTFGAVGTGTDAPALGDTTLQTEFFRKALATRSFTANVATLRLFLATGEGNAVLKEFGLFGEDASVTPGSGTLFNRVNIDRTKTASNTLTIESIITFS